MAAVPTAVSRLSQRVVAAMGSVEGGGGRGRGLGGMWGGSPPSPVQSQSPSPPVSVRPQSIALPIHSGSGERFARRACRELMQSRVLGVSCEGRGGRDGDSGSSSSSSSSSWASSKRGAVSACGGVGRYGHVTTIRVAGETGVFFFHLRRKMERPKKRQTRGVTSDQRREKERTGVTTHLPSTEVLLPLPPSLRALLERPQNLKVFHDCRETLASLLHRHGGVHPQSIVDTQVATAFLWESRGLMPQQLSLLEALKRHLPAAFSEHRLSHILGPSLAALRRQKEEEKAAMSLSGIGQAGAEGSFPWEVEDVKRKEKETASCNGGEGNQAEEGEGETGVEEEEEHSHLSVTRGVHLVVHLRHLAHRFSALLGDPCFEALAARTEKQCRAYAELNLHRGNGVDLPALREGDEVDGVVRRVEERGAWVDLNLPVRGVVVERKALQKFRDVVPGMVLPFSVRSLSACGRFAHLSRRQEEDLYWDLRLNRFRVMEGWGKVRAPLHEDKEELDETRAFEEALGEGKEGRSKRAHFQIEQALFGGKGMRSEKSVRTARRRHPCLDKPEPEVKEYRPFIGQKMFIAGKGGKFKIRKKLPKDENRFLKDDDGKNY